MKNDLYMVYFLGKEYIPRNCSVHSVLRRVQGTRIGVPEWFISWEETRG